MRRCLGLLLCCLLAALPAAAEEDALFPIRVNGLWGYINRAGEEVIAPQWTEAGLFSGGVARISLEPFEKDGLIDVQGNIVVAPEYAIEEYALSYRVSQPQGQRQRGYYDKVSGFFLPPQYDAIDDFGTDSSLILAWQDGLYGYLRRDTGEVIIPFQYNGEYEDSWFSQGYAVAADNIRLYDETGEAAAWGWETHLINAQGEETVFPQGIFPDGPVREGVLRIGRELDAGEAAAQSGGWGEAYGLAKPDGTILAEPRYAYVSEAADGCVCFWDNGLCGHMDLTGKVIVPAKYAIDLGGPVPEYHFSHGYAALEDIGDNWPETARWILLDRDGNEIFSYPAQKEGIHFELIGSVADNGCIWYWLRTDDSPSPDGSYGLLKIENGRVNKVTGPVFEDYGGWWFFGTNWQAQDLLFSQGLCAVRVGGLWGYINEQGEMVILPQWDDASPFYQGLAQVIKDGRLSYIDSAGAVVWQEP